jgi:hypothetical protein
VKALSYILGAKDSMQQITSQAYRHFSDDIVGSDLTTSKVQLFLQFGERFLIDTISKLDTSASEL